MVRDATASGEPFRVEQRPPRVETRVSSAAWDFYDAYDFDWKESRKRRPNVMDFEHVSMDEKVNSDAYLSRLKARTRKREEEMAEHRIVRPEQEQMPSGNVFEEFLVESLREQPWFGGVLYRTTEHDDWYNGVDAVIEWPNPDGEGSPVRMAIDFSTSENIDTVRRKLDTLREEAKVKYFRSQLEQIDGKSLEMRFFLPKVVIGADVAMMRRIGKKGHKPGPEHPLKKILLRQASHQIDLQIRSLIDRFKARISSVSFAHPELLKLAGALRVGTIDEHATLFENALPETLRGVLSYADEKHLLHLLPIKRILDAKLAETESTPTNEHWDHLERTSLNNQLLLGQVDEALKQTA